MAAVVDVIVPIVAANVAAAAAAFGVIAATRGGRRRGEPELEPEPEPAEPEPAEPAPEAAAVPVGPPGEDAKIVRSAGLRAFLSRHPPPYVLLVARPDGRLERVRLRDAGEVLAMDAELPLVLKKKCAEADRVAAMLRALGGGGGAALARRLAAATTMYPLLRERRGFAVAVVTDGGGEGGDDGGGALCVQRQLDMDLQDAALGARGAARPGARDLLRMAAAVAGALEALLDLGWHHNDVKPMNVMASAPRGRAAWAFALGDFGSASERGEEAQSSTPQFHPPFSPAWFASAEQWRAAADSAALVPRSGAAPVSMDEALAAAGLRGGRAALERAWPAGWAERAGVDAANQRTDLYGLGLSLALALAAGGGGGGERQQEEDDEEGARAAAAALARALLLGRAGGVGEAARACAAAAARFAARAT